jgi:hypothetical protein
MESPDVTLSLERCFNLLLKDCQASAALQFHNPNDLTGDEDVTPINVCARRFTANMNPLTIFPKLHIGFKVSNYSVARMVYDFAQVQSNEMWCRLQLPVL